MRFFPPYGDLTVLAPFRQRNKKRKYSPSLCFYSTSEHFYLFFIKLNKYSYCTDLTKKYTDALIYFCLSANLALYIDIF